MAETGIEGAISRIIGEQVQARLDESLSKHSDRVAENLLRLLADHFRAVADGSAARRQQQAPPADEPQQVPARKAKRAKPKAPPKANGNALDVTWRGKQQSLAAWACRRRHRTAELASPRRKSGAATLAR